eukprot:c986_g1_i1.p1 GENE.c986_g1_i1~~c986_g1_i1.p1  ORF type:complete len:254 (-),score=34.07 c986_g1_i1:98-859(-)
MVLQRKEELETWMRGLATFPDVYDSKELLSFLATSFNQENFEMDQIFTLLDRALSCEAKILRLQQDPATSTHQATHTILDEAMQVHSQLQLIWRQSQGSHQFQSARHGSLVEPISPLQESATKAARSFSEAAISTSALSNGSMEGRPEANRARSMTQAHPIFLASKSEAVVDHSSNNENTAHVDVTTKQLLQELIKLKQEMNQILIAKDQRLQECESEAELLRARIKQLEFDNSRLHEIITVSQSKVGFDGMQ